MGQALGQAQGQSLWQGYNAQTATGMETHGADGEVYSDAPPSYEDAVADVLPPVQVGGQDRGGYRPPETGGREDRLLPRDEKG